MTNSQNETNCKTVVFGLGSMGNGMAKSLLRAELPVWGFDVISEREAQFRTDGGQSGSRAEAVGAAQIVFCVVVNAEQTQDLLFGADGIAADMKPGSVLVSCATVAPEFAKSMAKRLAATSIDYLDAPMSGGSAKAATGQLSFMASGPERAFEKAKPALDAVADVVFRLGDDAGAGSAMKSVNQMLAGIHIAAAAEAVTFAMTQGIPPEKTLEVISQCAGTSWMFENRTPHIVAGDYSPRSTVDIFVKDLNIVGQIAHQAKFAAPMTATALQQFVAASGAGLGQEDDAAVAKVYARNASLKLP